jgi:amino acid transporter
LAGVLASIAVNLFTGAIFIEKPIIRPGEMAASIALFLLASAGAAVIAWYLDDMHGRWLLEGRPTDPQHLKDIVRKSRMPTTIVSIITLIAIVTGGLQLYLASLPVD